MQIINFKKNNFIFDNIFIINKKANLLLFKKNIFYNNLFCNNLITSQINCYNIINNTKDHYLITKNLNFEQKFIILYVSLINNVLIKNIIKIFFITKFKNYINLFTSLIKNI